MGEIIDFFITFILGSIIDFLLPFILGFLIGCFFGVFIASLMHVASQDSRMREKMEDENEQTNK